MSEGERNGQRADATRDASDALALARGARERLAARAVAPWWYAPGYGLGCGGVVASLALPNHLAPIAALVCLLMLVGLYAIWQRRSGLGVSGYRAGPTRRISVGIGVAFLAAYALALLLRDRYPDGRGPILCGVVLALIASRASAAWDRAWRKEILDGLS
jgi:hypothetical protein